MCLLHRTFAYGVWFESTDAAAAAEPGAAAATAFISGTRSEKQPHQPAVGRCLDTIATATG